MLVEFSHLTYRATGYYTGAMGEDGTLFRGGFLGEFEDPTIGSTIMVKVIKPYLL